MVCNCVFCFLVQCLHLPEVHDDVDVGAAGRFPSGVQTGVPVAMLALFWERIHDIPLPRIGESSCCALIFSSVTQMKILPKLCSL